VVNNAIVLIDYTNIIIERKRTEKGLKENEALDIFSKNNITTQREIPKKKIGRPKGSKNIDRKAVKSQKLTISLSEDEILQLKKHAEKEQRSVSSLIRVALTKQKLLKKAKSKY
jgi:hypothetical protein